MQALLLEFLLKLAVQLLSAGDHRHVRQVLIQKLDPLLDRSNPAKFTVQGMSRINIVCAEFGKCPFRKRIGIGRDRKPDSGTFFADHIDFLHVPLNSMGVLQEGFPLFRHSHPIIGAFKYLISDLLLQQRKRTAGIRLGHKQIRSCF